MIEQQIHAIYENGVLRPLAPLNLAEHQEVSLVIRAKEAEADENDSEEYIPLAAEDGNPSITWEQVHAALANIKGSMSDQIIRDRDERF